MVRQRAETRPLRAARQRLLADREFHRITGSVQQLSDLDHQPELKEYLHTANAEILRIEGAQPVRGRIAFLPETTFLHVSAPVLTFRWNRTPEDSIDRSVIVLVKQGRVEIESKAPVLRRDPGTYLITPHYLPVDVRVCEPGSEIVILSIAARHVQEILPDYEMMARTVSEPLSNLLLAPMYGFFAGICALSVTEVSDTSPLVTAATEVIRSTLRLIGSTGTPKETSLYSHAVRLVLNEYADPFFNVEVLAQRLGVSTRTLQAAFKAERTTVSSTLRNVRGSAAKRILHEQPRLTKSKVAELAGFGSIDALDRALRTV